MTHGGSALPAPATPYRCSSQNGGLTDDTPRVGRTRGATVRPLAPEPGKIYPNASIKSLRWSFHDELAEKIHAGLVLRLEVVARVEELRETADGPRWHVAVLEVSEASE